MIEIFAIYLFCKKIGKVARARGRLAMGYQLLLILLWLVFEFVGLFVGAIFFGLTERGIDPLAYIVGIVGAFCGAILALNIAKAAKPVITQLHASPVQPPTQPPVEQKS